MTLVRIGSLYLNLDRLTHVEDHGGPDGSGPLRLHFGEGRSVEVLANAASLRAWLAAHAEATAPG